MTEEDGFDEVAAEADQRYDSPLKGDSLGAVLVDDHDLWEGEDGYRWAPAPLDPALEFPF